ncbi:Peptidase M16 inactive domain protein [Phycisphaerae bacterium RAS1]|nr:Peptidase M16 inactive domain protein [Phycisphaerae bacterium RAS1]
MNRRPSCFAVLLALLISPGLNAAEPLLRDERNLTGKLANGVSWIYRQNNNPPGKMALTMHVRSGSLNESDAQRGLAHFIEHMCFNGTENFPPGKLVPYFESIGMEFGADLNAFTSFDQTAYELFLPDTTAEQIDKALMVLSDYAFRCTFDPKEIDDERGVILAEKRARENVGERIRDKLWPELYAGSRFAERLPIGTEEIVSKAGRDAFVDYYRAWYRPENITVMMVGDAEAERVTPLIEKWFGSYKSDDPARPQQGAEFKPYESERAIVVSEPQMSICTLTIYNILPGREPTTTVEQLRSDLIEGIAGWILQRRCSDRVKKGQADFQTAGAGVGRFFRDATLATAVASGPPEKWEKMLDQLIEELNRARQFGFTPRELELASKDILADAERAVRTESTRNSNGILAEIRGSLNEMEPVLSAQQELELTQRLLPTIKVEEVGAVFATAFAPGRYTYVSTTDQRDDLKNPSRDELLAAARAAMARSVTPPVDESHDKQLLAQEPTPGNTTDRMLDEELQITTATMANGVRVHHRFMDYKKDQVLVSIALAGGQIEETADNAGITEVAALILGQKATSRLNSTDITDLMTGKNIQVGGGAAGDAFTIRISGSPRDLEDGLRLAHALLTDGRIESSAFDKWREGAVQRLELLASFPEFIAQKTLIETLTNNDPRMTLPDRERIERQKLDGAQAWFDRIRQKAPIEVAVVGELAMEHALPLVQKYLGSLPRRPKFAETLDPLRVVKRRPGPIDVKASVETKSDKAMVISGFIGADARQVDDDRALQLASNILSSRLIKRVREELALVYSLSASNRAATVYRDMGTFLTGAACAPGKAAQVAEEIEKIYAAFAESGPTDEELANAKKQILNNLDTQTKEPGYWLGVLATLDLHNRKLDDEKRDKAAFESATAEQLKRVFNKYYKPERTFRVIAAPAASESPASAPAAERQPEPAAAPG